MNPLGSPEKDPLLQGDPLAPFSDGECTQKEQSTSHESQREGPTSKEDAVAGEKQESSAGDEPVPGLDEEQASSIDERSPETSNQFPFDGAGNVRTVVRDFEEARSGNLSTLNTAFDQGWRLDRVVYREQNTDLLFVLRLNEEGRSKDRIV